LTWAYSLTYCRHNEIVTAEFKALAPKIAVAGAGVMGLSVAHALRQFNVTVFDADRENSASAMAGGMLAPWAEIEHLPENFLDAAVHGIALWEKILAAWMRKLNSTATAV
jgi:protoporphyrinogen oxidase